MRGRGEVVNASDRDGGSRELFSQADA